MKTIRQVIGFLRNHVVECEPGTCGKCDETRECIEALEFYDTTGPDYIEPEDTIDSDGVHNLNGDVGGE